MGKLFLNTFTWSILIFLYNSKLSTHCSTNSTNVFSLRKQEDCSSTPHPNAGCWFSSSHTTTALTPGKTGGRSTNSTPPMCFLWFKCAFSLLDPQRGSLLAYRQPSSCCWSLEVFMSLHAAGDIVCFHTTEIQVGENQSLYRHELPMSLVLDNCKYMVTIFAISLFLNYIHRYQKLESRDLLSKVNGSVKE